MNSSGKMKPSLPRKAPPKPPPRVADYSTMDDDDLPAIPYESEDPNMERLLEEYNSRGLEPRYI